MYELLRAYPSWEVNCHSACQISHILWSHIVHHHVHTTPTTDKYPQAHESRPHFHIHNIKIHFKLSCLVHSDFTCGLFLTLNSSNWKCIWTSPLSYMGCTHNPVHPLWFQHPNKMSLRLQTMVFLIKKYSSVSCNVMWLKVWLSFY